MATEYVDIYTVKLINRQSGHFFFSPDTMQFFRSRASTEAIHDTATGNYYFVTSEQFDYHSPRLYTARVMTPDGSTSDLGAFQQYASGKSAWNRIKQELGA